MRRIRVLVCCASALGVVAVGVAGGALALERSSPPPQVLVSPALTIQAVYDSRGDPSLIANFRWPVTPHWQVCVPVAGDAIGCHDVPGHGFRGSPASSLLTPGPSKPGTVFEAAATHDGLRYVRRAPVWRGTVRAVSPAVVQGAARFGAFVSAAGARWTGGWAPTGPHGHGASFDLLSVEACRTATGHGCVNLSPQANIGYSERPVRVDDWFTGWYLFAFDQREAADTAFAEPGYSRAAAIPPVRVDATVSRSAPAGPIAGPARPVVHVLRHAVRRDGRVLVARVRCAVRCRVRVEVAGLRRLATAASEVVGSRLVGVPSRRGLGSGRTAVSVSVGAGPTVEGHTRLG